MASLPARRAAIVPTALAAFAVVVVMNLVHEAGHGLAGKAMGYDVIVRTNHAAVATGDFRSATDGLIMSAAGPLVTVAIALIAVLYARRGSVLAAGVVLAALVSRLIAAVVSLNYPNDEARISTALGLGQWTLFGIVILLLASLTALALRGKRLGWRWYVGAYIGASLGTAMVVLGESWFPALRF
ncbi:hypothetical protein GCM10022281_02140 [Sphingomonas rosea]|uniref:Peptidase M50B-like n=1 Tax=Sphingomonas rosea TaxID=335605 RepID=A0ABP7TJE8_9SPHN